MANNVLVSDVKSLLTYIPAVHKKLLLKYFMNRYEFTKNYAFNCVESFNNRSIQRKNKLLFTESDFLTRNKDLDCNSQSVQSLNKLFAVACEMMPEGRDFTAPSFTAQKGMVFYRKGKVYEIYDFTGENVQLKSYNLSKFRVPEKIAAQTVRIGVLKTPDAVSDVYPCGIKFFCCVDDDYNVDIVQKNDDSALWNGVSLF